MLTLSSECNIVNFILPQFKFVAVQKKSVDNMPANHYNIKVRIGM